MTVPLILQNRGSVCLVVLLCVCVIVQILGSPFAMVAQDTTTDVLRITLSEGFSLPEIAFELETRSRPCLREEFVSVTHLPVLPKSVFHPPQV